MRRSDALVALLIVEVLTPLGATAQVNAHPLRITPGPWERLSVQVANSLDSPIVAIRVEVPSDIVIAGVEPRPEWPFQVDSLLNGRHAIEWRGGWVARGELQEFRFLARLRTDSDADHVTLPVHLTRVGGHVESHTPRLFVDRTPELTSQGTAMLGVVALVVSVIALAIAIIARVARPPSST